MGREGGDEEGLGPLERGRSRYQRKDYEGALSAFTEVSVLPLKRQPTHVHSIIATTAHFLLSLANSEDMQMLTGSRL